MSLSVPSVNTLINSSNTQVFGNTSTGTALSVQQLGTGSVMNVATSTGTSALFVNSSGQVGVGTTNPQNTLNVVGSANVYGQLTYSTQPYLSSVTLSVASSAAAGWYRIASINNTARAKFRFETFAGGIQESVCVTTTSAVAFNTGWPSVRIDDQTIFNAGNNALSGGQIRMLSSATNGNYYLEVYLASIGAAYVLYVYVLEGDPRNGAPTLSNPIVAGSVPGGYNVGPTVPVNGFSVSTSTNFGQNAALLITSGGLVGINTTSPSSNVAVDTAGVVRGTKGVGTNCGSVASLGTGGSVIHTFSPPNSAGHAILTVSGSLGTYLFGFVYWVSNINTANLVIISNSGITASINGGNLQITLASTSGTLTRACWNITYFPTADYQGNYFF